MNLSLFFTCGILYLAIKFSFKNNTAHDVIEYCVDLSIMWIFLV